MTHRQNLQEIIKNYRDNKGRVVELNIAKAKDCDLQTEIKRLHKIKVKLDSTFDSWKVLTEITMKIDYATLSNRAIYFLEKYFSPAQEEYQECSSRLKSLYGMLVEENITARNLSNCKSQKKQIAGLENTRQLLHLNESANIKLRAHLLKGYNIYCENDDFSSAYINTFFERLEDYRITKNYPIRNNQRDHKELFKQMLTMTIFKDLHLNSFTYSNLGDPNETIISEPMNVWKQWRKDEFYSWLEIITELLNYEDRTPKDSWEDLLEVCTNHAEWAGLIIKKMNSTLI